MKFQKIKIILHGFFIFILAVLFAIFLRIFIFASFRIPSSSMEPTILTGDYIIVNKMIPGPRLFKNFNFFRNENTDVYRLKAYRSIRENDVLVFNLPYTTNTNRINDKIHYLKRCIAVPGDNFYIDNGIFKIKGSSKKIGNYANQKELVDIPDWYFSPDIWNCFPHDTVFYNWNIKNWGPLYIPAEGDIITIDPVNIKLYKDPIEYETGEKINLQNGKVFLGDKLLEKYIFQQNYYFMAGDYTFYSHDSRYWGLLPEDHIIEKAIFIWQSINPDTGKFRWKRFFNIIK